MITRTSAPDEARAPAVPQAAEPVPCHDETPRGDRLVVDGRVPCPRSGDGDGDADVDTCYGCDHLTRLTVDGAGREWVRCSPPSSWVAWPRRPRG